MPDVLPLQGVKVLDLSRLLPGPYATLLLADLGAQVDKVEEPGGGDYMRQAPPFSGDESAFFYALNRNKRSLVLNLKTPEGRDALLRLVPHYDVLVESFRPGVMEKLGLGWATLQTHNERLIYCAISGYGQTGPDRARAGHDLNYIARAGVLGFGGEPQRSPAFPGVQVADVGGSLFGVIGILAALQERVGTGKGRMVDISMTEAALSFLQPHLAARLFVGAEGPPLRRGEELLNGGVPSYGVYRTQDGRHLSVGSLEPKFFVPLCELLGCPELATSAYDTGEAGQAAREQLAARFAEKPLAHWVALFREKDLCVEAVLEGDEVLTDAQHQAREVFVDAVDPQRNRRVTHMRSALKMAALPLRPPPSLGQHSREILAEAGFSPPEQSAVLGDAHS